MMMHHDAMGAIAWTQWVRGAGAVLLLGAVAYPGTAVAAVAPDVDDYLGGAEFAVQTGTTFYAWTGEGESIDVEFVRADVNADVDADATVAVTDPEGENRGECDIERDGKAKPCEFMDLTSPSAGVWQIAYRSKDDDRGVPANWDIEVAAAGGPASGRVWTESYRVYQDPGAGARIDLYYLSRLGFQYRAIYRGYNGLWSQFEAGVAGLTHADTCEPINHSTGGMKGDFNTDLAACGQYKVFFDEPAPDLPESASVAGGEETWLLNPVREASLGDVEYRPADAHSVMGDLVVTVTDHQGTVDVELDLNGDGDFGDEVDRTITWGVSVTGTQQVVVPWDGLAGNEKRVRNDRSFNVRATIDRVGTIYFVNSDVEGRSGGIEVEYLNGPEAGEQMVYWDDAPEPDKEDAADQSGEIDSFGGARSWDFGMNSWGNDRRIQEWAYADADIETETVEFVTPPRPPKDSADAAAAAPWWRGPFGWVALVGAFTSMIGLGILLLFSRRSSRRDGGEKSQLPGLS